VVQNQTYQTTNGIDDFPTSMMITNSTPVQRSDSRSSQGSAYQNGVRMNDSFTAGDRLYRTASNASSVSQKSGRDPVSSSHSTVVTNVTSDGALVTTYTTRTTTIQEEPSHITKQYIVRTSDSVASPEIYDESEADLQSRSYSSSRVTRHQSSTSSSTLPREAPRVTLPKPTAPATLPRNHRPVGTSTPDSYEEERVNADGSVTKIRKVVSTTTHMMDNDEPVVEVTISPFEMRESKQTTRTTTTKTTKTDQDSSITDNSLEREPRSPRSPNGYLIEESVTTTSKTSGGKGNRSDGQISTSDASYREGSLTEDVMVRSSGSRGSARSTGSKTPTERPPAYGHGAGAAAGVSSNKGFVIEEHITTDTSTNVESAVDGGGYGGGGYGGGSYGAGGGVMSETSMSATSMSAGGAVNATYDEDEKKQRHEYEIDLLDLSMFLQTDDLALKANAAGYIQHLCYNDENIKMKIRELDIIPLLVRLLSHPNETATETRPAL